MLEKPFRDTQAGFKETASLCFSPRGHTHEGLPMHKQLPKRFLRVLIVVGSSLASWATASPAQDVFDEVIYFLTLNYGGFSGANIRGFEPKYQPQLDAACQDVKSTCPADQAYPIIQAMLEELSDKHTNFTPGGANFVQQLSAGGLNDSLSFGVNLSKVPGRLGGFVSHVVPGSSAAQAGVKRGDWLVGINGTPLPRSFNDLAQRWFTAERSNLPTTLSIVRQGQVLRVTITARNTPETNLPTMAWRPDGIAVLHIPHFLNLGQVGSRVHTLVREAQARNTNAIIMDLRGNPGGFWLECFVAAAAFVPDGLQRRMVSRQPLMALEAQYRDGQVFQTAGGVERLAYSVPNPTRWAGPMAVLVNANSASCSEFFTLDVQAARRGLVFGERTAGVANTATAFTVLSDGSALQVTTSQSLRPDGTPFPEFVTPTISVQDDLLTQNRTGIDAVLEQAISSLR
jgi:carboxyl-terminal processing protease